MSSTLTIPAASPAGRPSRSSVPVIPESAPFSAAQRGWLNGFFAGMMSGGPQESSTVPMATTADAPAPVEEAEEFPWHDPALPMKERLGLAEGKKPERQLMAAMAQLDCGACGYICQTYAEAIARGEEKDLSRCTPGGRDTSKMLKNLIATLPKNMVAVYDVKVAKATAPTRKDDAPHAWDRNNPFPARLLASKRLNGQGSAKDTRLVEIDLRDSGIIYRPGDALGVYPENCPDHVREILEALDLTGAEDVPGWDGAPMSLFDALLKEFTITRPTPDLMDILARSAKDEAEKTALAELRDSETLADDVHVLDLLRKFPSAKPDAGSFVATLSPLSPRLYSISSSQAARPKQVHLTVGAVRYENASGRSCRGVCSTFLADRIRPGQSIRVFVHPSHKFGLPEGNQPVIMVGPGTGIAPFRSFLQHRSALQSEAKNWLFFGDQKESCDYLYRDELADYLDRGVLSRLDLAFSRDGDKKVYVQHRMIEQAADIWKWLHEGAHFYVCGDAKRMAVDVDAALRKIVMEQGAMTLAQADEYVAQMVRSGRYQRDVY